MGHSGPESTERALENFLTKTESKRGHDVDGGWRRGGCIDGR